MNEKPRQKEPEENTEEPILFEKSYIEKPNSPPWILIGFLLFAIIGGFWKKFITPMFVDEKPAVVEAQGEKQG